MPRRREIFLFDEKKTKNFGKIAFKRLTGQAGFGIISKLSKYVLYGLRREVTANSGAKAASADNFR